MNLVAKSGRKVVLLAWIFFIVYSLIFSFSYVFCFIVIFLHLVFKRSEREILADDSDIIVSTLDAKVVDIHIDENEKEISIILKKSFLSIIFDSSELRAPIKSNSMKITKLNGVSYSDMYFCNATQVEFESGIRLLLKPAAYSLFKLDDINTTKIGDRIGIFSNGLIELKLPYDARILVGIGDKILANTAIARIGE